MDRPSLEGALRQWHSEFCDIAESFAAPPKFWRFLAGRLIEQGVNEDKSVVRVRMGDTYRKVRVTGQSSGRVTWEGLDNPSFGMALVKEFHTDDREKLALALDALEG